MWSKTKKAFDNRLAGSPKKRVRYGFEVYTTNIIKWWTETSVFYIYVDDELWFATNPMYFFDEADMHDKLMRRCSDVMDYKDKFYSTASEASVLYH